MNGFVGADVEELEQLARRFDSSAHQLSQLAARSTLMIATAEWTGADIERLRAQWDRQAKPGLGASSSALGSLAVGLKQQAQQQRTTSNAGGTTASGTAASGSDNPAFDAALRDPASLSHLSSDEVAAFWAGLTDEQRQALIAKDPMLIGNLSGVPFTDRIAANQINAENEYNKPGISQTERDYLKSVLDPKPGVDPIQLVTYDPEHNRIVEMIGTPSENTTNVITWVPGTFSNLEGFYGQGAQTVPHYLVDGHPDTVVLVAKDGYFPGDAGADGLNLAKGIAEANLPGLVDAPGQALANLQNDIAREDYLDTAKSTAIGHSWGLADVTKSEMDGAHYDQVVSLSGAWMPQGWTPQAGTSYADYSYVDILQQAEWTGAVGDGNNPRSDGAFDHGGYYQGPDDLVIRGPFGITIPNEEVLLDNHNLIATDDPANAQVLRDLVHHIFHEKIANGPESTASWLSALLSR